jgi:hypothetical protein
VIAKSPEGKEVRSSMVNISDKKETLGDENDAYIDSKNPVKRQSLLTLNKSGHRKS